jgi:hypothetical protein
MRRAWVSSGPTSITELDGKAAHEAAQEAAGRGPGGSSTVAARLCGASSSALGENTST